MFCIFVFVFPGDAPATITQYVAWMKRQFNACLTPRSIYLSIFNSFRVIRCLSQCVSPKIAISPRFFVSHGNAPGAITLNAVWMEREFDAYKLSRRMCPSNYNRFWDRARYLWNKKLSYRWQTARWWFVKSCWCMAGLFVRIRRQEVLVHTLQTVN